MTPLQLIYDAEREACRCQFLAEAAEQDYQRARRAYVAAVARVRELVREAVEMVPEEVKQEAEGRTLFDVLTEGEA